jgi:alkylation response protein AidB-like acyl-CoA dehydrogenase
VPPDSWTPGRADDVDLADTVAEIIVGGPGETSTCNALRAKLLGDSESARNTWEQLGKLGYLSITLPERYGGSGAGLRDALPLVEQVGRSLFPAPVMETVVVCGPILARYGSACLCAEWLPSLGAGDRVVIPVAFAPGSDLSIDSLVIGEQAGEAGAPVLVGSCEFVPFGAMADALLVLARQLDSDRVALVLVRTDDPAVSVEPVNAFDPTTDAARVTLNGVASYDVLASGRGGDLVDELVTQLWLGLGMLSVGAAQRVVAMARDHAVTRQQFGVPIGAFQAIKHQIVDMHLSAEALVSLVYYGARELDVNGPQARSAVWAARERARTDLVAMAEANVQIHGAMGFTEEMDCHLFVKRAWTWSSAWASGRAVRLGRGRAVSLLSAAKN